MALKSLIYENNPFEISYEILHPTNTKDLIILHGWGSNKNLMKQAFGNYFLDFRHIYIDLPGFGASSLPNIALTTQDYANIIEIFLNKLKAHKDLLMGHSFGGKVSILLAPQELILLSSAGIVPKKSFKVKSKILLTKILNKTFPFISQKFRTLLRSKDVQNMPEMMYQTFKNVVNEDFSPLFANFPHKAHIFWGKEDTTTPLFCGETIATLIKDSNFYALRGDHFFFLQQGEEIAKLYSQKSILKDNYANT
ncbi:alpha/beta fold hydrolase [Helicobacter burdigaliensis]|uniref:alpha/beta fold hydrolase n=1 Tax=Helicobacter burdigaliensis TaxID=2315334 RepID=UPI000EF6A7A3|nr:alpha/beta hydrolase [Helicobacter burdigaliensis]